MQILVVEDEFVNFYFIKELLIPLNYQITHVENGEDAVLTFKENKGFNLVIMDVGLPKLSGIDAAKQIKQLDQNIPIIAITGFAETLNLGSPFDYTLIKPINDIDLIELIGNILKK